MGICAPRVLSVILVSLMLAPHIQAESAVILDKVISLAEEDLGIEGAVVDPSGEKVIVYGADTYLELLDSSNPSERIELVWNDDIDLHAGDFHPGGQTALIVGDNGEVLRYAISDHSITDAGGDLDFGNVDLFSVAWNPGGSWAYIGGQEGWLWRMRAAADGGAEVHPIAGRGSSDITAIDCHTAHMLCVVTSIVDGIGVIDRDHEIHWIGGTGYPWQDVYCPPVDAGRCVAISDDRNIGTILLNSDIPWWSDLGISQITEIEGTFTGVSGQWGDRSIIVAAPFSMFEHDLSDNATFPWLENSDVEDFDANIAGQRIVSSWATDRDSGWILTDRGTLIQFHPPSETVPGGILGAWILIAIPVATLLVILSVVLSFSPRLQNWFTQRFGTADEKRIAKRESRKKRGR